MPATSDRPPFESYKGADSYVFVSYAHRDCAVVFPELARLRALGVNIWYDEGIDPGNEWPDEIATALRGCSYFLFFVSPLSVASVNCRNEAYFALELKKPFLSIYIEETDVKSINAGLGLSIGSLQAVMRHRMDEETYERKILKSLGNLAFNATPKLDVKGPGVEPNPAPLAPIAPDPGRPVAKTGLPVKKRAADGIVLLVPLLIVVGAGAGGYWLWAWVAEVQTQVAEANKIRMEKELQEELDQKAADAQAKADEARLESLRPHEGKGYINSLKMRFVPAGTKGILFSVYDTRVKDFQTFVSSSGYDATAGCFSYSENGGGWKQRGDSWKSPGFPQTDDSPVVGVSWNDAKAFCQWETDRAHKLGSLKPEQLYRLPTDAEWSAAAGSTTYPWGETWPPPPDAGNFALMGDDARFGKLPGKDGFPFTSPVGSFKANPYGLYDMSGNAWQWCEDWYKKEMNSAEILAKYPALNNDGGGKQGHVLRGACWEDYDQLRLESKYRGIGRPDLRGTRHTFRCVIVVNPAP